MFKPLSTLKQLFNMSKSLFGIAPIQQDESSLDVNATERLPTERDRQNFLNATEAEMMSQLKDVQNSIVKLTKKFMSTPTDDKYAMETWSHGFIKAISVAKRDFEKAGGKRKSQRLDRKFLKETFDTFNKKEIEDILRRIDMAGKFGELKELVESENNFLPISFVRSVRQWEKPKQQNQIVDRTEIPPSVTDKRGPKSTLAITEPAPPSLEIPQPEPSKGLQVIEVDDLLPEGENEEEDSMLIYGPRERSDEPAEPKTQPRMEWIVEGLRSKGFMLDDMMLYREKRIEGIHSKITGYQVLEALKGNYHFQVAVSETIGNATYIIRNPIDFREGQVITIADLKKDPTVFQVSCYTQTQWMRNISHYAFTPLEDLNVQLKTRLRWADKKAAVEDSFGQFYLETFQLPKASDTSIIEHGELAGRTTWARLSAALRTKSIVGLEHVSTFKELRDHVFGPDPQAKISDKNSRNAFHNAVMPSEPQIREADRRNFASSDITIPTGQSLSLLPK